MNGRTNMGLLCLVLAAGAPVFSSVPALAASTGQPADGATASPAFTERRAIEALERLAMTTPINYTRTGAVLTLSSDDLFESGSGTLSAAAGWRLDHLADALRAQGGRTIVVRGYTDALGDPTESTTLSQQRADAVRDYFVGKGVEPTIIRAVGHGSAHPVADNSTPSGRAANRRLEIEILAPQKASATARTTAKTGATAEKRAARSTPVASAGT